MITESIKISFHFRRTLVNDFCSHSLNVAGQERSIVSQLNTYRGLYSQLQIKSILLENVIRFFIDRVMCGRSRGELDQVPMAGRLL